MRLPHLSTHLDPARRRARGAVVTRAVADMRRARRAGATAGTPVCAAAGAAALVLGGADRARHARQLLGVLGAALLLLVTSGCAARRPATTDSPVLRVGSSGDYPPFSVRAADGTWSGFDVAVARAYAEARGRRLALVPFRWPELAARLAAGDFDVAMSGVTVRADRLLVGTTTAAVARAEAVVLVPRGAVPAAGIDRAGIRIAVNRGGHLERVARARLAYATLVPVDDNRSLAELLTARAVDAVVTDTLEAATFPPAAFEVAARLSRDRKAYWVGPGHDALATDFDTWLLAAERDGALPQLRAAWLGGASPPALAPELARVVDLAARRLMLMPAVAAAKRAAGLPIVDERREAEVIARAGVSARSVGLDTAAAERFARAQIDAARAIQAATRASAAPGPEAPTLAALRPCIDALDEATRTALVTARAAWTRVERAALAAALRADAEVEGFDEAHASAIAAAIAALVVAPGAPNGP